MTRADNIRFLETSIRSLEGARSKFIMNLEYGKSDIPQVEETIARLKEELKLLKSAEQPLNSQAKDAMNDLFGGLDEATDDVEQGRVQTIGEVWKEIDAIYGGEGVI